MESVRFYVSGDNLLTWQVSAPYSTPKHWAATGDRVNYIRCKEPYLSV